MITSSAGAGCRQLAVVQDHDLIAETQRQVDVMHHHQGDELPFAGLAGDGFDDLALMVEVQGAGGFIQQQHARLAHQGLRQPDQLPLPTGQGIHRAVGQGREVKVGQDFLDALQHGGAGATGGKTAAAMTGHGRAQHRFEGT